MARNNHNDWTDELREMIDGVELSPSEGGWERLEADLRPRKTVWWPYAVSAAACLLLGGVFLFRERSSGNVLDVVSSAPSAMVSEGARVESEPSLQPEGSRKTSASQTLPQAVPPLPLPRAARSPESLRLSEALTATIEETNLQEDASTDEIVRKTAPGSSPVGSLTAENGETGSLKGTEVSDASVVEEQTIPSEEGGPQTAAETEPGIAADSEQVAAGWDDLGDEPIARQRRQRRKITVTVSAGGAFGSAGNGIYFAQAAPVTKAGGEVMDITEVIQHSTPKQTALGLSIPISDKMDIGTGIDHMELNSVVGSGSQNLEWLGVPLRLGYRLAEWGTSSISLGAGFKGEKCLSSNLLGMDYTEPFQWAANLGADCRVRIFGPVSFSLTPELSYYFTDTVLPTYRTDHPLTFTMRAGLSLNL